MKRYAGLVIGLLLGVWLWGCAARDDVVVLDNRLYTLQRQTQQVKEEMDALKMQWAGRADQLEKKIEASQQPLLQNQASSLNELEAVKGRLQTLQGRLESQEFSWKREAVPRSELETLSRELKEMQGRLQRLEAGAAAAPAAGVTAKLDKKGEAVPEAPEAPAAAKDPEKARASSPEEVLNQARTAARKKNFEEANKKYSDYLRLFPKGKHREEVLFELAESLGESREYEEAILTYQKLIKSYPKSRLLPEALYGQASLFLLLKDKSSAKLILERIVKEFPKSSQAQAAQKKLNTL